MRIHLVLYLLQHLVLSVFWILKVILIGVQWYLVLICSSLVTYDVECVFMYFLLYLYILFVKVFNSFVNFKIELFMFVFLSLDSILKHSFANDMRQCQSLNKQPV